ncbi:MAG: penicillin-binding protein activator LpoB [Candidatus Marinimicrobia bacterium]|nr:penicillin-binding protein activator LpoB [Candidatus Neomarinimicrobiota bacterium]MDD5582892.1 penicillin-binding protein activator LpoB [Candidatus Neomarinimicrobiota bacterium]
MCRKITGITGFMLMLSLFFITGCGSSVNVQRTAADTPTDLSGYWNDTDSRLVAEEMVNDLLSRPWLTQFTEENGYAPKVIVGTIRLRDATEHIRTNAFIKDIERELINSGKVQFVASPEQREEIRSERLDQQQFASEETAKRLAQEQAADYMLQGSITMFLDQAGGEQAKYYQVDLELIDVETNQKVWIGTKKIKKLINQKRVGW